MRYSRTQRRIVRLRLAVLFAVVVAMFVSVIALSAATPAAGAATSPYDATVNSYTDAHGGNDVASEQAHENGSTNEVRFESGAGSNASLLAQFSRDDGMRATLECDGDATAVVTVEVLEGSYAGEGSYEVTCGQTLELPAPEEAVTLRITVEIEGEQHVRVIEYDPEEHSHPEAGEWERDRDDDERRNDTGYDERFGSHAEGHASVDVHFDSDDGLTADVECEGNVTAVVTIEVVEGSYGGEGTYEVTCGESIALPAPEEAVTLRITVEIEGEQHVRVIEYDPEGPSILDVIEEDREDLGEDREEAIQRLLERLEEFKNEASDEPEIPLPEPDSDDDDRSHEWNGSDDERDRKDESNGSDDDSDRKDEWSGTDDWSDRDRDSGGDETLTDCDGSADADASVGIDGSAEVDDDGTSAEGSGETDAEASASVECTTGFD